MISINICDDEEYMLDTAYKGITEIMSGLGQEFHINRFASGAEMLSSAAKPDIYFLDIQMEPFDGMETARRLRTSGYDGIIIFMTVLGGQVYDSFEVQPFDFLVKPLDTERLRKTLERAVKHLEKKSSDALTVQVNNAYQTFPFYKITYCEVLGRKVSVHRQGETPFEFYDRLDDIEKKLDGRFFRCHRSYIVNLDHIQSCKNCVIKLSDNCEIPVSRRREQELMQALMRRMRERRK